MCHFESDYVAAAFPYGSLFRTELQVFRAEDSSEWKTLPYGRLFGTDCLDPDQRSRLRLRHHRLPIRSHLKPITDRSWSWSSLKNPARWSISNHTESDHVAAVWCLRCIWVENLRMNLEFAGVPSDKIHTLEGTSASTSVGTGSLKLVHL